MTTALMLIDVQRNMLEGPTPVPDAATTRNAIAKLLERARQADALVVHVRNNGPAGDPDEPETEGWQLVFSPLMASSSSTRTSPTLLPLRPDWPRSSLTMASLGWR